MVRRRAVLLRDRKLSVDKPRLRRNGGGAGKEIAVAAYGTTQDREAMGRRMLDLLMRGVSTRKYEHVIPAMAETVGVSKPATVVAGICSRRTRFANEIRDLAVEDYACIEREEWRWPSCQRVFWNVQR